MTDLRYKVGAHVIDVRSDDLTIAASLDQFYARSTATHADAIVHVRDEPPTATDLLRGPFEGPDDIIGIGHVTDREWVVRGSTADSRAIAARKLMRTTWLATIQDQPMTVLHASAFAHAGRVYILMAHQHGGKSTLLFDALMNLPGATYIANDALLVQPAPDNGLTLASIPVFVHAKPDMDPAQLQWLEHRAGARGLAVPPLNHFGAYPYTACVLGADPSPIMTVPASAITWVLPQFWPRGSALPSAARTAVGSVEEIVRYHAREDWMTNSAADGFGLLRPFDVDRFRRETRAIAQAGGAANAIAYAHSGSVAELIRAVHHGLARRGAEDRGIG